MQISGTMLPPGEATAAPSATVRLSVGQTLTGRVSQVTTPGNGVLRFPDGSGFVFSGGYTLKEGEQVRVEVLRVAPELTFRLMNSESGSAARLAGSAEQSLMRVPDLFARILSLVGQTADTAGGRTDGLFASLFRDNSVGGRTDSLFANLFKTDSPLLSAKESALPLFSMGKGGTLAAVLQKVLPSISAQGMLKGETADFVRLLQGGSQQEVVEAVRLLREAAADLQLTAAANPAPTAAELDSARSALHRLGDLLTMQDILPRAAPTLHGDPFLGYRLFWLTEGGLGEAIWRQESEKNQKNSQEDTRVTSMLISLNMTQLGSVQVHLAYAENSLRIAIGAEDEQALTALRSRLGELRQGLLAAELPLRTLDLSRLSRGGMNEERQRVLGLGSGFSTEV